MSKSDSSPFPFQQLPIPPPYPYFVYCAAALETRPKAIYSTGGRSGELDLRAPLRVVTVHAVIFTRARNPAFVWLFGSFSFLTSQHLQYNLLYILLLFNNRFIDMKVSGVAATSQLQNFQITFTVSQFQQLSATLL
jgi:hypothetical protein